MPSGWFIRNVGTDRETGQIWLETSSVTAPESPYMNAPYASLSIRDDAKVKIAPVHSDCECSVWLRSLMGSAG